MIPRCNSRYAGLMLGGLWLCFVLRGFFFAVAIPIWEPVDEFSHFAYIERLTFGGRLITKADTVPPDVTSSFDLLPLPGMLIGPLGKASHLTYEGYWSRGAETRDAWQLELRQIRPATKGNLDSAWLPIYERQQPPLYYALMVPFYWVSRDASLPERIILLRLAGVLIASLAVPCVYRVAATFGEADSTETGGSTAWGLASAAILVSMPGLLITASRVGNEALAIGVGSYTVWAAVRFTREPAWREATWLALALTAGLLTKAYFLSTFFVLAIWFSVRYGRNRQHLPEDSGSHHPPRFGYGMVVCSQPTAYGISLRRAT